MIVEIIYGKEFDAGSYKELAAPENYSGHVEKLFPMIETFGYPWKTTVAPKPTVFCYTKGLKCRAILSCVKWFAGNSGNYFAQHLIFEKEDDLIDAGPAWLIKRRGFYIETLTNWKERDREKTEQYDWKPKISQSDYCIGLERKWELHVESKINDLVDTWNNEDEQKTKTQFVLLFDPNTQDDTYRLDLLYDMYAKINKSKRWAYQFCTFDSQRTKLPPKWDIVFVANSDKNTQDFYKKQKYNIIDLRGAES